jgi:anti-anti-sigma regulatory factor
MVPEIHRIRTGDRVLLGLSVVVAAGSSPPSAQVVLGGELCSAGAPALRQQLGALVERGVVCLYVDVSKLTLCTAAGVEVFEEIDAEVTRRGGGLWLQGAAGVVDRVFQVLGVRQEQPSPTSSDRRHRTRVPRSLGVVCDEIVAAIDGVLQTTTATTRGDLPCHSR